MFVFYMLSTLILAGLFILLLTLAGLFIYMLYLKIQCDVSFIIFMHS